MKSKQAIFLKFLIVVIGKFAVPDFRKIHYPEMVKFRYHFWG